MSELEAVTIKSDNGYKTRWGVGKFLYRQDGKKLTVEGKRALWIIVGVFVLSSGFAILRPVTDSTKPTIDFGSVQAPQVDIVIPEMTNSDSSRLKRNSERTMKYERAQIISRHRLENVPSGLLVKAKLLTGASNGPVKASLLEAIMVNGEALAEAGAVIVGIGSSSEERLNIEFTKLVFNDGKVQQIRAQACDGKDQTMGLKGNKVAQNASMLAAGVGLNFAGGLAEGLQETNIYNGVAVKRNNFKNAALNGAAKASLEQSKEIIEKWKQQKSVIEVKQGTEICILFSGE